MEQIAFVDSLRTGFALIDEQHALFLSMLTDLAAQIEAGHHRQGVLDAFQGMRLYADGHFSDEEALMDARGYPQLPAHRVQHDAFRGMVAELENRLGEGVGLVSLETLEYLGSWFIRHIRDEDMRFATFVRENDAASS
ncbi:bacteriohemerythrin [Solidesulfovibrio magneticus]|nr:hemerythrin family protein [Solidesulfovibrio magneticus]